MDPISRGPQRLADGKRRQHKTVGADAENQSLDGGERQRQFHEKSGADTGAAVDLDSTPKPFDVPPHYVHADSASRHFGHATRGGKTRTENQRVDLRLGRRAGRFQEVLRNGHPIQLFGVEPRPVVGDRDDDIAPFVIGAQRDTAMSGLAVTLPCLIILDAVINAVAQHMHERVADFLHDVAIEFCLVARRHHVDALAGELFLRLRDLLLAVPEAPEGRCCPGFLRCPAYSRFALLAYLGRAVAAPPSRRRVHRWPPGRGLLVPIP